MAKVSLLLARPRTNWKRGVESAPDAVRCHASLVRILLLTDWTKFPEDSFARSSSARIRFENGKMAWLRTKYNRSKSRVESWS